MAQQDCDMDREWLKQRLLGLCMPELIRQAMYPRHHCLSQISSITRRPSWTRFLPTLGHGTARRFLQEWLSGFAARCRVPERR